MNVVGVMLNDNFVTGKIIKNPAEWQGERIFFYKIFIWVVGEPGYLGFEQEEFVVLDCQPL